MMILAILFALSTIITLVGLCFFVIEGYFRYSNYTKKPEISQLL